MKCPYKGFDECIVENCPSCNYKEIKQEVIDGRYPTYISVESAIKEGYAWKSTKTLYEFVSCKLIENSVQPIPPKKEIINNVSKTNTNISIKRSIF